MAIPRGLTARISGFHPGGPGSTPGVGKYFDIFWSTASLDEVAEWLRRWTANPMGSRAARLGVFVINQFLISFCFLVFLPTSYFISFE